MFVNRFGVAATRFGTGSLLASAPRIIVIRVTFLSVGDSVQRRHLQAYFLRFERQTTLTIPSAKGNVRRLQEAAHFLRLLQPFHLFRGKHIRIYMWSNSTPMSTFWTS